MSHKSSHRLTSYPFMQKIAVMLCLFAVGVMPVRAVTPCSVLQRPGFRANVPAFPGSVPSGDAGFFSVGDFNNDLITDVLLPFSDVAGNPTADVANAYLGSGQGLSQVMSSNIAKHGQGSTVVDLNNDGKLDLVVANGDAIQTLIGTGTGTFSNVATYNQSNYQAHLVSGDLNGDGKADVAMTSWLSPGIIRIYFGFGTGTLAAPVDTGTGDAPRDIKTADLNADGKPDFVTVGAANGVSVVMNLGGGSFAAPVHYPSGIQQPSSLATGDFNGDGKVDVAIANGAIPISNPSLAIMLGNGTNGFGPPQTMDLGLDLEGLVARDFTGDGILDLAVMNFTHPSVIGVPDNVVLLSGNGAGLFNLTGAIGIGRAATSLATGDFNNDTRGDLAVAHLLRGMGAKSKLLQLTGNCNPRAIKSDYDGDGRADVAVWRPSDGTWRIRQSSDQVLNVQQWGGGIYGDRPAPGDYDGDGRADLAVYRNPTGAWYILNSSNGSASAYSWGTSGDVPVPGDYDGDLRTDVAVYRPSTGAWWILRSSDQSYVGIGFGISTDRVVQGDYDGDGKTDLAVWREAQGVWYVLYSSDSSFHAFYWGTAGDIPTPGDFNGDGRADLAVFRPANGNWYFDQWGLSGDYIDFALGTSGNVPAPADYDGDGQTDAAQWRSSSGDFSFITSLNGRSGVSAAIGTTGDLPVSVSFAP